MGANLDFSGEVLLLFIALQPGKMVACVKVL